MSCQSKRIRQLGTLVIVTSLALAVTACGGSSDADAQLKLRLPLR
jgi:hypothetical protein